MFCIFNKIQYKTLKEVIGWGHVEDIVFNPEEPDEMWICKSGVWSEQGVPVAGKYRVMHSTDGGMSWYDYSTGLSAFPVMTIEYQMGSNKRLFAGTDCGVFIENLE
ncbi:MAG: hypothetical protein K9G67_05820 [Bacteroidales bacterium]|nr:hypothetical protein [Bacteroidales bacterium]MCF8375853.1 hypothetical protein [Bacteroidales bacterium]MCF8401714.1 hypothetical protein [Bacteroidales bacterium]